MNFLLCNLIVLTAVIVMINGRTLNANHLEIRSKRFLTSNNYGSYAHVHCVPDPGTRRCKDNSSPDANGCCGTNECSGSTCNYCLDGCRTRHYG